jgi:hypothetical protein
VSDDNINCHYVSRSLTRPWEGRQRELHFYDFAEKKLDHLSSKDLFARRGLNTRATENWLRDNIEAPLGRFLKTLWKRTGPVPSEIGDIAAYKALLLLVPLQVTRLAKVNSGAGDLDQIFDWSPARLDEFVATLRSVYSLVIVQGHPQSPLFFTEHGFFMVPFPGADLENAAAPAIPLNQWEAVIALPRSMHRAIVSRTLTQGPGAYINNCSIGTNANRVVIHPGVLEAMEESELIAEIEATRLRNRDCYRASLQVLNIVSDALSRVGSG